MPGETESHGRKRCHAPGRFLNGVRLYKYTATKTQREVVKNNRTEEIWEFVHGEADASTRADMETAMETDARLREEVEAVKRLSQQLRDLMPATEGTAEALEDQILAEWEIAEGSRHWKPKGGQDTMSSPSRRVEISRSRALRLWTGMAFAAAAGLILMLGVQYYPQRTIQWARPDIETGVQYRGETVREKPPIYAKEDMRAFYVTVKQSVQNAHGRLKPSTAGESRLGRKSRWRLSTKLRELPEGKLTVHVEAYDKAEDRIVEDWTAHFLNAETFVSEVDEFGLLIAKKLVTAANSTM